MDPSSSTNTFDPWGEIDDSSESLLVARHIKDPIHNYIPISVKLSRFIDTRQFQRLRLIKQLGTTSYVWPSASHTRFEHCLGVAYLARQMAMHIQHSQPELGITDRDVDCVEIAGLCHDLGHGPWSHVWDGMFIPVALKDVTWQHEMGSEMMFDALIDELNAQVRKENELKEIQRKARRREERRRKQHLREEGGSQSIDDQDEEDEDEAKKDEPIIPPEDQAFIKALIAGDHSRTPQEKPFLFDIVANKRNGLDVDNLVNSARVLDDQICYDIKDANHIYDICVARFKLHKSIYNHKAAKAIEYMIIDALLLADPYLKIAERVLDAKKYLHLTDDIMSFIEASEDPELASARAIFDRIRTRQLYKCVDFKVIDWPMRHLFREHVTPKRVVEECNRILKERAAEAAAAGSPSGSGTASASTSGPSSKGPSTPTPSTPLNELMEAEAEVGSTGSSTEMGEREFELELEGEGEEGQGEGDGGQISISDVIVDFSTMHYGMKDKNPVDSVRFYSKRLPKKSMEAGPGEYSNLRPQYFAEDLLRVYTKDPKNVWLVQAGYRAVLEQLQAEVEEKEKEKAKEKEKEKEALHLSPPSNVATASAPSSASSLVAVGSTTVAPAAVGLPPATATATAPTPPATEAPSTPTASVSATHSRDASFSFGFSLAPAHASPSPLSLGTKAEGSFSFLLSDTSTVVAAGADASVPATAGAATTSSSHTATSTTTTGAGTATTIATTGHSHSASALAPGSASAAPASATSTPFGPNKFMTVPPSYAPPSPTRSGKKAKVKTTLTQRGVGGGTGGVGGSGAGGGTGGAGGGRSTSTSRKRPREPEGDENPVPVGGASGVSAKKRR
ncbi:hypothetical protein CPB84DRAFT_1745279 [Gymnopilus junonius]|uniref:HD/PDEase domain-containing protein n=1 Tax=Gymnopilus junonius TaxID=109634 RepID=A0A9P5NV69_GYMJU|nr:hypothetical protein CPB84DRAFT_1745279 [Gymnopilus junonius]